MSRLVPAGTLIRDQVDFFSPSGSINRTTGVVIADLTAKSFVNNTSLAWPLADGSAVIDSDISAGTIYFHEISGSAGYYSVRYFFDRVGFWRFVFRHAVLTEEVIREYDVVNSGFFSSGSGSSGGLNASFTNPLF